MSTVEADKEGRYPRHRARKVTADRNKSEPEKASGMFVFTLSMVTAFVICGWGDIVTVSEAGVSSCLLRRLTTTMRGTDVDTKETRDNAKHRRFIEISIKLLNEIMFFSSLKAEGQARVRLV